MSPASTTARRPEPSAQAKAWFAERRAAGLGGPTSLEEGRRGWEAWALGDPPPPGTRIAEETIAGVPCERVALAEGPGLVFLLHGGGYSSGSPRTHRRLAAWLSHAAGCPVLVPDYRLAPEHPFPGGLEDALAVWRAISGRPVAVVGDSAGGGLALALMLKARDHGLPQPRAAALLSPWTDLLLRSPSLATNAEADPTTRRAELEDCARLYAQGRDLSDPLLSPVGADLSGLPPLLIQAGSLEILRDDALRLAERAEACGVDAQCEVWPGLWHVWHFEAGRVSEADEALERVGTFLKERLR